MQIYVVVEIWADTTHLVSGFTSRDMADREVAHLNPRRPLGRFTYEVRPVVVVDEEPELTASGHEFRG